MIATSTVCLALLLWQVQTPPVQRPSGAPGAAGAADPVAPATIPPATSAEPEAVTPTPVTPEAVAPDAVTEPVAPAPEPTPTPEAVAAPPPQPAPATALPPGPPFYAPADMAALRQRYGLEAEPPVSERRPVFRCLVADPTCGFVLEINATSAYAYRLRQGDRTTPEALKWNSARVQYDIWLSIPTMVETRGKVRYTRLSLGPKGGVVASDTRDLWGNVGIAGRYWFGRKRFAPNIEFTSALVFKVAGVNRADNFSNVRGPVGFTADVGFGLGGFGALVFGVQFDSPLAREDVPEVEQTSSAGMFFLGFRGNIVWGAPAAMAVGTHALANRRVTRP